jgi:hypothetical protein
VVVEESSLLVVACLYVVVVHQTSSRPWVEVLEVVEQSYSEVVVVQIDDRVGVDHPQRVEEVVASMMVVGNYYSYFHPYYSSYPWCWGEEDLHLVLAGESWDVPNYVHSTHH